MSTLVPVVPYEVAQNGGQREKSFKESPESVDAAEKKIVQTLIKKYTDKDFGAEFKKKNKRAAQPTEGQKILNPLEEPCNVVVHDYGPEKYECYESKQKFENHVQLLTELPALTEEKPEWAHVRSRDSSSS
jgi:hypothetical protein